MAAKLDFLGVRSVQQKRIANIQFTGVEVRMSKSAKINFKGASLKKAKDAKLTYQIY